MRRWFSIFRCARILQTKSGAFSLPSQRSVRHCFSANRKKKRNEACSVHYFFSRRLDSIRAASLVCMCVHVSGRCLCGCEANAAIRMSHAIYSICDTTSTRYACRGREGEREMGRLWPMSMMLIRFDAQRRNQRTHTHTHILASTHTQDESGCGNRQTIKSFKMPSSYIFYCL